MTQTHIATVVTENMAAALDANVLTRRAASNGQFLSRSHVMREALGLLLAPSTSAPTDIGAAVSRRKRS